MEKNKQDLIKEMDKKIIKKTSPPKNLWEFVERVKKIPVLREWIPINAYVLQPIITEEEGKTLLYLFLSNKLSEKELYTMPWGYVVFEYEPPVIKILKIENIWSKQEGNLSKIHLATAEYCEKVEEGNPLLLSPFKEWIEKNFPHILSKQKSNPSYFTHAFIPQEKEKVSFNLAINEFTDQMRKIEQILEQLGDEILLQELYAINDFAHTNNYNVGVIGEFSRGKSTLINRLLNQENLLPKGIAPTTAFLTKISYRDENGFYFITNGRMIERPFSSDAWEGLFGENKEANPNEGVKIYLNDPFLRQTSISLYDTPGANDTKKGRLSLTQQIIGHCDATIVVVSALQALTLSEKAFIEQNVFGRKIPRIAVVITYLDALNTSQDVKDVIKRMRHQVDSWGKDKKIHLLAAHSPQEVEFLQEDTLLDGKGIEDIKKLLEKWAKDSENTALKYKQISDRISTLLQKAENLATTRLQDLLLSQQEREEQYKKATQALNNQQQVWRKISESTSKKVEDTSHFLGSYLEKEKEIIKTDIFGNINATNEPINYAKNQLISHLRTYLEKLLIKLEQEIRKRLTQDIEEVRNTVINNLQYQLQFKTNSVSIDAVLENTFFDVKENEIVKYSKYAAILSTAIGMITLGPLGMLLGGATIYLTDRYTSKVKEEQKKEICQRLEEILEQHVKNYKQIIQTKVKELYDKILAELKKEETYWLKKRQDSLAQDFSQEDKQHQIEIQKGIINQLKLLMQTPKS